MFTFNYKDTAGFIDEEVHSTVMRLQNYIEHLNEVTHRTEYDGKETSINLSYDEQMHMDLQAGVKPLINDNLKYVFVVGIGGSNLGPMAVYNAINSDGPELIFVDTVSPALHKCLYAKIENDIEDKKDFLVSIVSKSGSTTETIANFEVLVDKLTDKFGDIYDRIVVTSGEGSKLWEKAKNKNYKTIVHPNVGGRYSILSSVGQVPLMLAGLNVSELLKGAQEARDVCLSGDFEKNVAAVSAALQFMHYKKGIPMNDNFFFNPEMESVGKWYRQLMGESIGKAEDLNGKKINNGITPLVSIGSVDLHSMVQLYLGGPRNKFTTFIYADQSKIGITVPDSQYLDGIVDGIGGKNMAEIMNAIYEGTKIAYDKGDRPFMEIELEDISERSLGQFMQYKMIEMMYLAKLMNVDPFDQPNVEDYKSEMREILGS